MQQKIEKLKNQLALEPHPEGGYFKETYRSVGRISQAHLGEPFSGDRNYATGIYFLLTSGNFSAFHKIHQDEMWHFYGGSPIRLHVITPEGNYFTQLIGRELGKGELPQFVVHAECWFASEVAVGTSYSLAGCTVSPGFDFQDFEMAKRDELFEKFPNHKEIIKRLTRENVV